MPLPSSHYSFKGMNHTLFDVNQQGLIHSGTLSGRSKVVITDTRIENNLQTLVVNVVEPHSLDVRVTEFEGDWF